MVGNTDTSFLFCFVFVTRIGKPAMRYISLSTPVINSSKRVTGAHI